MARPATGQVVVRQGRHGRVFAARFYAYGRRHYVTLTGATSHAVEALVPEKEEAPR